jgi:hypothetical protein
MKRAHVSIFATLIVLAASDPAGAGIIYVTNQASGTVGAYNDISGATLKADLVSGLTNPTGIAVDGMGHLYVASVNGTQSKIGVYNASNGAAINANLISGLSFPRGSQWTDLAFCTWRIRTAAPERSASTTRAAERQSTPPL